jgi:hypothetical protein
MSNWQIIVVITKKSPKQVQTQSKEPRTTTFWSLQIMGIELNFSQSLENHIEKKWKKNYQHFIFHKIYSCSLPYKNELVFVKIHIITICNLKGQKHVWSKWIDMWKNLPISTPFVHLSINMNMMSKFENEWCTFNNQKKCSKFFK